MHPNFFSRKIIVIHTRVTIMEKYFFKRLYAQKLYTYCAESNVIILNL
jgi:hypothetical protein